MARQHAIKVTSNVARDFLQNAAYFNTMPRVVWEYVANSLDAVKDDLRAIIAVEITSHEVTISDNSRGMSEKELGSFFEMHGENPLRKKGKRVRGRFGTGKCAAFGLANLLCIDTIQAGSRNIVELHRRDIEQAQSGEPFPVRDIEVNQPTDEDDGTIVVIREFNIKRLDIDKVKSYVERHLSRYRTRAHVSVNGHVCKFKEPPFVAQFECFPPTKVSERIGDVCLNVKVSPVPLGEEARGIDILSHGIWHETTLEGIERKEYANQIFGQIDVPILEDGEWSIPAFDNTRNNTLNRPNPAVATLMGWLSKELEEIRLELVRQAQEKRQSEMEAKLAKEADRISNILNQDFAQQELELEMTQRVRRSTSSSTPRNPPKPKPTTPPENKPKPRKPPSEGNEKRRKAVFSIEFERITTEQNRSRYAGDTKTIFINLDHPQIASALETGGNSTDSREFREVCYEVAAVEYAIALPYEKLEKDELYPAEDALFDVKETIDRVTKRFMEHFHTAGS